jgi:Tetracyclin repressor-like, C-terminal domain
MTCTWAPARTCTAAAKAAKIDPLADLYALAVAYRRVLFGGVQSFDPSGVVGTGDPVRPLIAAIDRALSVSVLAGDATSIALSLWVTLHGLVALELAGALDTTTAETTFRSAILATLRGWTTPTVFSTLRRVEPAPSQ